VPVVDDATVAPIAGIVLDAFCWEVRVAPRTVTVYPVGAFVDTANVCATVSVVSPSGLVEDANLAAPVERLPKYVEVEEMVNVRD
jgi:hypothetical protein